MMGRQNDLRGRWFIILPNIILPTNFCGLFVATSGFAGGRCARYDWVYVNRGGGRHPATTSRGTNGCNEARLARLLGHHNVNRPCSLILDVLASVNDKDLQCLPTPTSRHSNHSPPLVF
jgi:hypothetical protein